MARINIEDSLLKDNRFFKLTIRLGSRRAALGAVVEAWLIAQEYWKFCTNGVPKNVWMREELSMDLIEVGLAYDNGDFIYVSGSEKHFAWIRQKVEAGKSGGVKSGKARAEIIDEKTKRNEAQSSAANPLTLTLPLSLTLPHAQALSQKQNTPKKRKSADADVCPFDLESVYQKYPRKEGKLPGMRSLAKQLRCQSDFESFTKAVENYAKATIGRDSEHIKMFSSFVGSEKSDFPWREWVDYKPRAANKAQAQSDANVDALKQYLEEL